MAYRGTFLTKPKDPPLLSSEIISYAGQLDRQIKMLGELPQIPVRNGYAVLDRASLSSIVSVEDMPWGEIRRCSEQHASGLWLELGHARQMPES